MNFSKDTKLTEVPRLARHLALVTLLAAPIPAGQAALHPPQRPASLEPIQSSPSPRQATPAHRPRNNRTYLAMVGPAALAYADYELPLPPEPVMPEPPKPKPEPAKNTAPANTNAALPPDSTTPKTVAETPDEPGTQNPNGPKPVSILPDDTRREIRAEDVLPYFQFPGASDNGAGAIAVPITINQAPAPAPPSTATYRQQ